MSEHDELAAVELLRRMTKAIDRVARPFEYEEIEDALKILEAAHKLLGDMAHVHDNYMLTRRTILPAETAAHCEALEKALDEARLAE